MRHAEPPKPTAPPPKPVVVATLADDDIDTEMPDVKTEPAAKVEPAAAGRASEAAAGNGHGGPGENGSKTEEVKEEVKEEPKPAVAPVRADWNVWIRGTCFDFCTTACLERIGGVTWKSIPCNGFCQGFRLPSCH